MAYILVLLNNQHLVQNLIILETDTPLKRRHLNEEVNNKREIMSTNSIAIVHGRIVILHIIPHQLSHVLVENEQKVAHE